MATDSRLQFYLHQKISSSQIAVVALSPSNWACHQVIDQRKDALRSRELHFHVGAVDGNKNLPTLIGKLKIDWLDFPVDDILQQFAALKDGILWYGCRAEKAQVTVLLPGKCCYSKWTNWLTVCPTVGPRASTLEECRFLLYMHKHRKFTRARHMWLRLDPNWNLLRTHMYTDWPGIHTYDVFLSECCMAQRFVVRAVALLSAKLSEKRKLSEMIGLIQQALHV